MNADWHYCQKLADHPEVDEALRAFLDDPTNDSGVIVVRAILEAQAKQAIKLNVIRNWPEGMEARVKQVWDDLRGFIISYKLYDLQRTLKEFGFTMTVTEDPKGDTPPAGN